MREVEEAKRQCREEVEKVRVGGHDGVACFSVLLV